MQSSQKSEKLIFISNMAAPYMVDLCYAMQDYYDSEFWFYEHVSSNRPVWWKVPLGEKCKVLPSVYLTSKKKYICPKLGALLSSCDPDVVMIGGLGIPSNWMAYRWAVKHKKKVILFSEMLRFPDGRKKESKLFTRIVRALYDKVDLILTAGNHANDYFVNTLGFDSQRVVKINYPMSIEKNLRHSLRKTKDSYVFLFSHRLVDIYNPLMAINIFSKVLKRHPESTLLLNGSGELRTQCEIRIDELGLKNVVTFLDEIDSWESLHQVYQNADISISPAIFSNGNGSIIEAMASGMGIVLSDNVLTNRDLIASNDCGFVCELSVDAFVEAIEQYFVVPALINEHGKRGRQAIQHYRPCNTARSFHKAISSV